MKRRPCVYIVIHIQLSFVVGVYSSLSKAKTSISLLEYPYMYTIQKRRLL